MREIDGKLYDEDVDYSKLKVHKYKDCPGEEWYVCPKCGNEYLSTFITTDDAGRVMCIDCWSKENNK